MGEKMETVEDFIFLGSKITVDGDCRHEIKRRLLLGRKAMTNLESILESRDITLPTKIHTVKAMVFPVVMYGCESWTIKNWCFQTVVLEKTLMSPLESNEIKALSPKGKQSWIIWKDWCWSWSSNTLATWYEEPTHWKKPWCWERLKAAGEERDKGWDCWMAISIQWTQSWTKSGRYWWTGKPGMLQSMGSQRVRHDLATEQQRGMGDKGSNEDSIQQQKKYNNILH